MAAPDRTETAIRKSIDEMRSEITSARAGAQPAHHHETRVNQPKAAAFGIAFAATCLGAIAALDLLAAAEDDLTHGLTVSARESVSAAISSIEDAGKADLELALSLVDLPPLWQIDAALNQRRTRMFEVYLPNGVLGDDGVFREVDTELDREFVVHPNDVWIASTGTTGQRIGGAGLTSLIDFLTDKGLANIAGSLARKFRIEADA